jgi:hypothetical protein
LREEGRKGQRTKCERQFSNMQSLDWQSANVKIPFTVDRLGPRFFKNALSEASASIRKTNADVGHVFANMPVAPHIIHIQGV